MGNIFAFEGRKGAKIFIYEKKIFKTGLLKFEYTFQLPGVVRCLIAYSLFNFDKKSYLKLCFHLIIFSGI
jgi:hypothetical protein